MKLRTVNLELSLSRVAISLIMCSCPHTWQVLLYGSYAQSSRSRWCGRGGGGRRRRGGRRCGDGERDWHGDRESSDCIERDVSIIGSSCSGASCRSRRYYAIACAGGRTQRQPINIFTDAPSE